MLDETLVILTGEFGRTPKLGGNVGTPTFSPTGAITGRNALAAFSPAAVYTAGERSAPRTRPPRFR